MTNPDRITVTVADHVAEVVLTRSDTHNALDFAMFQALNDAQDEIAADSSVRAVVIRGEGPSFCSGLDFASIAAEGRGPEDLLVPHPGSEGNFAQRAAHGWTELEVPVIAALHGNCLGGGFQLAMAADVRIAAPDVRLSVLEVKWGLIPDMGISQNLPRMVRLDVAKELIWTGRSVAADEAVELGLVTRVADDPVAVGRGIATEIAAKSPHAIRAGKQLLTKAWNAPSAEALRLEEDLQRQLLGSPNQIAAVQAGMSGELPEFDDPGQGDTPTVGAST